MGQKEAHFPAERTHIGYFCWVSTDDENDYRRCRRDYYVLPNGSAEVVLSDKPFSSVDDPEVHQETKTFPPGTWRVVYPVTTFGSRGGCWIEGADGEPNPNAY